MRISASSSTLVVNMVRSKCNMVADKKLSPQGKQDIGREGKSKMKRHKLLSIFLICIILIFATMIIFNVSPRSFFLRYVFAGKFLIQKSPPMPTPSELFREHLLDPIPESVKNIKADRPSEILGYTYTLRFNINRADLELLIKSGTLERVWNVKYENGYLNWDWDPPRLYGTPGRQISLPSSGMNIIVYHRKGRREPAWFKLKLWDNPEAYVFYKKGDLVNFQAFERDELETSGRTTIQVLLYNENESEAYFIVSSFR